MTIQQFSDLRDKILKEPFHHCYGNPLKYAIDRKQFERDQMNKLIDAGSKVADSKTISKQVEVWKEMLKRLERKQNALQEAYDDIRSGNLDFNAIPDGRRRDSRNGKDQGGEKISQSQSPGELRNWPI